MKLFKVDVMNVENPVAWPVQMADLRPGDLFYLDTEPDTTYRVVSGFVPTSGEWFGSGEDPGGFIQAERCNHVDSL